MEAATCMVGVATSMEAAEPTFVGVATSMEATSPHGKVEREGNFKPLPQVFITKCPRSLAFKKLQRFGRRFNLLSFSIVFGDPRSSANRSIYRVLVDTIFPISISSAEAD
ncbi:hypothetical protein SUGI_1199780 [Cryptomeria japonica]|nr:hypothetical protein SUGI_1199780 [Cryptomeria japonica]